MTTAIVAIILWAVLFGAYLYWQRQRPIDPVLARAIVRKAIDDNLYRAPKS